MALIEERVAVLESDLKRLDREMTRVRAKVHDLESDRAIISLLAQQIPKLTEFMEHMNVREQVAKELDERNVRGVSGRDRLLVASLSACLLIVSIVVFLPKLIP